MFTFHSWWLSFTNINATMWNDIYSIFSLQSTVCVNFGKQLYMHFIFLPQVSPVRQCASWFWSTWKCCRDQAWMSWDVGVKWPGSFRGQTCLWRHGRANPVYNNYINDSDPEYSRANLAYSSVTMNQVVNDMLNWVTNRTQTDIRYLFLIDNRLWLVGTFFTINLYLEIKKCFQKTFFKEYWTFLRTCRKIWNIILP